MNKILFNVLTAVILAGCSSKSGKWQALADSLSSQCPVILMDGELELTKVSYSKGLFSLILTLCESSPTSTCSLRLLDAKFMGDTSDYYCIHPFGSLPFMKGIVTESSYLAQIIHTIELQTNTVESTQGYLPLSIIVTDKNDSIAHTYNVEWEYLPTHKWLNAILPMEMRQMFGWTGEGTAPILNEEIKFNGIPFISEDGYLNICCSYEAMPYFKKSHAPIRLQDIKGKYFSFELINKYLKIQMEKYPPIKRFLNACVRRSIGLKVLLYGDKDKIDHDLALQEQIKDWKSWGGNDIITIDAKQLSKIVLK